MDTAAPHSPDSGWQPGDRLTLRGRAWTVVGRSAHADCEALRLAEDDGAGSRTFLLPFDRPRRHERRLAVVSPRAWGHRFARHLREQHPHGGLRHMSPDIDLIPYQLEPALATLRDGHPRLLLADAVGSGKTIEAGIILRELAFQQDGFRALVLVPAGLRAQWRGELRARFALATIDADAAWLRAAARELPPDVNPWSPPGIFVASLDFVKRPEALQPLERLCWDVVVVDEAHAASAATDRRAAADALARRARRVLLLTGTPPREPAALADLCAIGAAAEAPPVLVFARHEAGRTRPRRSTRLLPVRPSGAERLVHRLLERYTARLWRQTVRGDPAARLVSIVLRKRALSSAASLAASLARRAELLAGAAPDPAAQLLLPLDPLEDDARGDAVEDAVLGAAGLTDVEAERRWLQRLADAAAAAAARESKTRALVRLLRRIGEPAIVFTEYRDSLLRLGAALDGAGVATCTLHGGMTPAERGAALAAFARGDRTLVATDAASEGLNLQQRCRVVVHYELPWTPSRLVQRAGRVDRVGQRRRVHEIALVALDTAEALVLGPLARRAAVRVRRFAAATEHGDARDSDDRLLERLTESRIAEAVFEGRDPAAAAPATGVLPGLTLDLRSEASDEAARLAGFPRVCPAAASDAIAVAAVRRTTLARGVVLLFEVGVQSPARGVVSRALVAIHAAMPRSFWPRRPRRLKSAVAACLPEILAAVQPALDARALALRDRIAPRAAAALERLEARAAAVEAAQAPAARRLVQTRLFDARQRPSRDSVQAPPPGSRAPVPSAPTFSCPSSLRAVLVVSPR